MIYSTEICTSGTNLLTAIKTNLLNEGWVIAIDNIPGGNIKVKGITDNNHECWINFSLTTYQTSNTLKIQGALTDANVNLSGNYYAQYLEGQNNKLYFSCDNDSFGLFIFSPSMIAYGASAGSGIYGGFLSRAIDFYSDQYAWGIGYIHSIPWVRQVAKSAFNATIWQQVNRCPSANTNNEVTLICPYEKILSGTDQFSSKDTCYYTGTIDRFVKSSGIGGYPSSSYGVQRINEIVTYPQEYAYYSPTYYAINGGLNPLNNQPILDVMYISEGANTTGYGDDGTGLNKGLYYRGIIKHCYVGGASLPVGAIVTDRKGSQYVSTGNEGWQLLKISF